MRKQDHTGHNSRSTLILGSPGFPYGPAEIQKLRLIARALRIAGMNAIVVNRKGVHPPNGRIVLSSEGLFDGTRYVYTSGTAFRPTHFVIRNTKKLVGFVREFALLARLGWQRDIDAAIVSSMDLLDVAYYSALAWLFRFPLILNYVELVSSMKIPKRPWRRLNDFLFDRWAFVFVDAVLPISQVLLQNVARRRPQMRMLKLPVLADFERFSIPKTLTPQKYFLLCAAGSYIEILVFAVKAFEALEHHADVYLYLVVNGTPAELEQLAACISKCRAGDRIRVMSDLSDASLTQLYVDAIALLIPLRPTAQDAARFPFKIGEYAATGNPIITTNYGEISNYFRDRETAFVSESYNITQFAEKMREVLENPDLARRVGRNGQEMARTYFSCENFAVPLRSLIQDLNDNSKSASS